MARGNRKNMRTGPKRLPNLPAGTHKVSLLSFNHRAGHGDVLTVGTAKGVFSSWDQLEFDRVAAALDMTAGQLESSFSNDGNVKPSKAELKFSIVISRKKKTKSKKGASPYFFNLTSASA